MGNPLGRRLRFFLSHPATLALASAFPQGNISDVVVVGLLLQAFALQAAPLLGPTTITTSNATFYANYIDDQR